MIHSAVTFHYILARVGYQMEHSFGVHDAIGVSLN